MMQLHEKYNYVVFDRVNCILSLGLKWGIEYKYLQKNEKQFHFFVVIC